MPLFRVQGVDELKMEAGQSAPLDVEVNVGRHGDWGKAGMVTKTIFFVLAFLIKGHFFGNTPRDSNP